MQTYVVSCPGRPDLPREILNASTSYNARKDYAARHGVQTFDCIARRLLEAEHD